MRAWLGVREKGVPFEERVIELDRADTNERIRAVSPNGRVPALVDGDLVICESLAILEYLEDRFPSPPLLPRELPLRAEVRMLASIMHAGFAELRRAMSFEAAFTATEPPPNKSAIAEAEDVLDLWELTRARHEARGPWLVGALSIADLMFAPVVHRLRGFRIELGKHPRAARWMDELWARPSVREWMEGAQKSAS
jgi:glutathione S-transferase